MSKARTAAFHALRALDAGQIDLPSALARSRRHLDDDRDRALTMEIVSGTVRWQRNLDHLIVHFAQRALQKVDGDVTGILRLSLYQLLHLDRVPAAAIVDDAVNLTRAARKSSASGFVNAVLRQVMRQRNRLPLPPRAVDGGDRAQALAYLGITHSHPDWLVARWLDRYGLDEAEQWVRFNNESPQLTIRANTLRTTRAQLAATLDAEGVETAPTRHAPQGLQVTAGNPLRHEPDGSFLVQDEASQLVSLALAALPGQLVLDLCASPGGKTTALAGDMLGRGLVVACDVRDRRMRLLRDTVRTTGVPNVRLVQIDSDGQLPFGRPFDRVLVDAPCSGLGTLRRDPDIKWRRTESELPGLAARQLALLTRAAGGVRPGGRLVYATCSSEPEENERVVDAFLTDHADFTRVDLRRDLPPALHPLVDAQGALRTSPMVGLEAFYAAALERAH